MSHVFPPFDPNEPDRKRGRALPLTRGEVPIRVLIPNIFTLMALCAGLTAIRMAIEHRWDLAVAAILIAAFLDAIDGRIARLLRATTRFGAELDSLADFVNFGVAPGLIIFIWALDDLRSLGWIVVLVFALCAVLRLARFNTSLDAPGPRWKANYFVGMPAPAGAIVVLLPLYLELLGIPSVRAFTPLILLYTLGIAFLMVSRVPTFSGKLVGERISRNYVLPVFVLAAMFAAVLFTYQYLTLVIGSLLYLAVIPLSVMRYNQMEKRYAETGGGDVPAVKSSKETETPPLTDDDSDNDEAR